MEAAASRRGRLQMKYVTAVWESDGFYLDPRAYLAELPKLRDQLPVGAWLLLPIRRTTIWGAETVTVSRTSNCPVSRWLPTKAEG